MEDLLILLIKEYQEQVKNSQDEREKEILNGVINKLGCLLYTYRPSATFKLFGNHEPPINLITQTKEKEKKET
jgi:hypothetical protein|tara:strand:- start:168 stop:386 length:219 start_codon:yes stop_codon:yes gene_type:complete